MKTRTEKDVREFNEAIDKCSRPVWLVTPEGEQFNLKSTSEYYKGMAKWVTDICGEIEIFTCSLEDELIMENYYLRNCA